MDFTLSQQQLGLQQRVREFCTSICTKDVLDQLDGDGEFPEELYTALAASGLLKYSLPESAGGEGGGILDVVLITEELASVSGTLVNLFLVNAVFCGILIQSRGSESQRAELLSKLGQGKLRFAFALTEPGAGSDASAIATVAHKNSKGWTLTGNKRYTTGASVADWILVVARSDMQLKPSQGTSVFLVPSRQEGLTITPMHKIAGNSYATCELQFNEVQLPDDAVLGLVDGLHGAWPALRITGAIERLCVSAVALGISRTVLKDSLAHCRAREQFGQPISAFQAVSHRLADMATTIEGMKWLVYAAAFKADQGEDASKEISMAKVFASEQLNQLVLDGLHLLGGAGYLTATAMTRYQREALLCLYAGGTTEIQKNIIARMLEM